MSSLDRANTSFSSLKQLLDVHYMYLLSSFLLFIDLLLSVIYKEPLILLNLKKTEDKVSLGVILFTLVLFSFYSIMISRLKKVYDDILYLVLFPFYRLYINYTVYTYSVSWYYSKVNDFQLREYALSTSNLPLWQYYLKHEENKERESRIMLSLFSTGFLVLIAYSFSKVGIISSLNILSEKMGVDIYIFASVSCYWMGVANENCDLSKNLVSGLSFKTVKEIREDSRHSYSVNAEGWDEEMRKPSYLSYLYRKYSGKNDTSLQEKKLTFWDQC